MTETGKFDRYTIIKALVCLVDKYEQSIAHNKLLSLEERRSLIQTNNNTIKSIIDNLIERGV